MLYSTAKVLSFTERSVLTYIISKMVTYVKWFRALPFGTEAFEFTIFFLGLFVFRENTFGTEAFESIVPAAVAALGDTERPTAAGHLHEALETVARCHRGNSHSADSLSRKKKARSGVSVATTATAIAAIRHRITDLNQTPAGALPAFLPPTAHAAR